MLDAADAGRTVEETHTMQTQAERIDRIDRNKNTPDLRTLVTTHQELGKETSERGKTRHTVQTRGLQTVKEDELLCSLIRTAHEIHYR